MSWLPIAVTAWMAVAMPLGLLLGRAIRVADEREVCQGQPSVPDFVPVEWTVPTAGRP